MGSRSVRTVGMSIYIPDTSAISEGIISRLIESGRIRGRIVIHKALLLYFEELANQGKTIGYVGLDEIRKVKKLCSSLDIPFEILGDSRRRYGNNIDVDVRELALEMGATLITANRVQAALAESMGIDVIFVRPVREIRLSIERFFDSETMSVHLKEGTLPRAKKGRPGDWRIEVIGDRELTREELEAIANEVLEAARMGNGFIEIDRAGSTIVQLGKYRIIITKPPMSDGWEITAVRPLARPRLEEYNLPPKLLRRLEERAEGILIAGAPGMGKTTFAQALAEYYLRKGKVIKTIESPRDMYLPPEATQYSKVYASPEELHDILLLSRPDYTVFDELRNDEDFKLYVDLRLAGIGMIGVVHATTPIDAIQRFLRRVDLGEIPSIIDTVIFIDRGQVSKVYTLEMTVKLPTGLREAELSRPVVEVRDFLTGELEYEIYTFGEQTMIVPVRTLRMQTVENKIRKLIERTMPYAQVTISGNEVVITVPREYASNVKKKIRRLRRLENELGMTLRLKLE